MNQTEPRKMIEGRARSTVVRVLLVCGIVSSLLYVGTDIAASMLYPGYSYTSQMISELGAIGAPTRPLWIAASLIYNPLVVAFGVGVWMAAGSKRSLRITGGTLAAYGVISGLGPFVPMQVRGSEMALTDVLHIACTVGIVVSTLAFVAFGANARGTTFRFYSIATIALLVLGGALAGTSGGQVAAGGATPMMGILERVNVYAAMLWVLMLGVVLLRPRRAPDALRAPHVALHAPGLVPTPASRAADGADHYMWTNSRGVR